MKRFLIGSAALAAVGAAAFLVLALAQGFGDGTARASLGPVDKEVLDITFDDASVYPAEGQELSPPNEFTILKSQNVPLSVTSVDINNGPEPIPGDVEISFYVDIPAGCEGRWYDPMGAFPWDVQTIDGDINVGSSGTVWFPPVKEPGPRTLDLHFQTLESGDIEPIGLPVHYTRFFELHCFDAGDYVFRFCNRADVKPPDFDPNPGNNLLCEDLTVHSLHNADIKVQSFESDPPGPLTLEVSTYNVIDLIENKHNNGPQDALSSVSWTMDPVQDRDGDTIPDVNVRWEAQVGDLCTYQGVPVACGEGDGPGTGGSGDGLPSLTGDNCQDDIDNDADGTCDVNGCTALPGSPDPDCGDIDDIHFTVPLFVSVPEVVQRPLKLHCKIPDPAPYTLTIYNDEWPIDPETGDPWEDPDPSNNSIQLDLDVTCAETHYKFYSISGTSLDIPVDLETQFGTELGVTVTYPLGLLAPALKNQTHGTLDATHLKAYGIVSSDDPPVVVNLTTQFGVHTNVEVDGAALLMVPAAKEVVFPFPLPPGPLETAPHYKCYAAYDASLVIPPVDLETQFGLEPGVPVLALQLLCAPAIKTIPPGPPEGDLDYPHLACYSIIGPPPGYIVNLETQFGFENSVGVAEPVLLCLPAQKEIVETDVDKQVLDIVFDDATAYPFEGQELSPSNELTVTAGQDVMISGTSVDINNGPAVPADVEISGYVFVPAGCSGHFQDPGLFFYADVYTLDGDINVGSSGTPISPPVPVAGPRWVDVHAQTLDYGLTEPVGVPMRFTRFFTLNCAPGDHVFTMCNRADVKPPYVEAVPGDELLCEDLTVHAQPHGADVHYKSYQIFGPPVGIIEDVETQFGYEPGVMVMEPLYLLAPALKTIPPGPPEGDPTATHLKAYNIVSSEDPNVIVNLTTQFGVEENVEVGPAQSLLVPAAKEVIFPFPAPPGPLESEPHYKCYDAAGTLDPPIVDLETQFGYEQGVDVGPLDYMCAPALKGGIGNLNYAHLACYTIPPDVPPGFLVILETQFGFEFDVDVLEPRHLCVPAEKEIVGPDLKLVSQTVTFPPSIDISQDTPLIIDKELHNNGPHDPVDADITKTITLPPDCTINGLGPGGVHVIADSIILDQSVLTPYQEIDTIHCTDPSHHTIYVDNWIEPADGSVDPDPSNNGWSSQVDFVVLADADLKLQSVTGPTGPLTPTIFQSERHTVTANIHNNGPNGIGPAGLWVELTEASPPLPTNPDSDGDGWVDSVEMIFQSSPINPLAMPEGMEASPVPFFDTCTDGVDNDLNFLPDALDPKCVDSDGDGLSNGLEFALGGAIVAADPTRQPEHGLLPWTCNDLWDNDGDGDQDDAFTNPINPEQDGPDPDGLDDCSKDQIKQIPPPVACASGWQPQGGESHFVMVEPAGTIIVTIGWVIPPPGVSTPVAPQRDVVIDCFTPGVPITENITAWVNPIDPHVTDLDPGNNEATTTIDVEATAAGYADIKIMSWTVDDPPGVPTDIDVSDTVLFHTTKTIHNNGGGPPTGPVDVGVVKSMNVPDDCDGSVHSEGIGETFDIAAGVTYGIDTDGDTIVDPPGWLVAGPTGTTVGPLPFSQYVIVQALPGLIDNEITVRFDVLGVDVSVPESHNETFDMHCYEPSTHEFVLRNMIYIKAPDGWADPDPTNNYAGLSVIVNAIAYTDLKILDQQHIFPTDIDVSQNEPLAIQKVLHNNGPQIGPVDVNITKTITLPPDCTINPWPPAGPPGPHGPGGVHVITDTITLDESVTTPYPEFDDIHCTEPSPHVIEVHNWIEPADPHVVDTDPGNNEWTDVVNFNVLAYTDGKITSSTTVSPPTDVTPFTDVPITVRKVLHNNGGYGPADFTLTGSAGGSTPPGCTVTPPSPSTHNLAVSVASGNVDETWTINCARGGPYTIDFDNTITPTDPHVVDTDPLNDDGTTSIIVTAGELQAAFFSVLWPDIVIPVCEPAALLVVPGVSPSLPCPRAAPAPETAAGPGFFGLDFFGPGSDDMDALSTTDFITDPTPRRHFSVDLASVGAAGCAAPDVNSEASLGEAHGDIFTDNAPPNCNALYQDELQNGLNAPGLPTDDMDALAHIGAAQPGAFSINWASAIFSAPDEYGNPILGADVLVAPGTAPNDLFPGCNGTGPVFGSPCVYVPANPFLGLDVLGGAGSDDLDALCWFDNNGNQVPDSPTWIGGLDDYFFSLAPGSASLAGGDGTPGTGDDLSPADILAPGPFPTVVNSAASLGLLTTDNLDALKCFGSALPADGKILSATIPSPVHEIQPNTDTIITVHKELHNNGPVNPADFDLTHSYTVTGPAGCTVTPPTDASYNLAVSVTTAIDEDWTVNCPQGGPYVFTFENTLTPSGNVFDPDPSNDSGSAILSLCAFTDPSQVATADCDGDGYIGDDEDHVFTPTTGQDQDPCGGDAWPSDLWSSGGSTNNVNLQDVGSFIAPAPHFNTSPGDFFYDVRWDINPGPNPPAFPEHINLLDVGTLLTGSQGFPPMLGGLQAFGTPLGPSCPWPP